MSLAALLRSGLLAFVFVLASAAGLAQGTTRFDPSRDLEGFDRAAASEHRDLYPIRLYLDKTGQEMTPEELAKLNQQWMADRDAIEKRIEAIRTDPRESYLYSIERQFAVHPYFSRVSYDIERSVEGCLFLVQRPPPGSNITRDPRKLADFYGPPMRRMEEAFTKGFAAPLGLTRRNDYVAYTVCILGDEDEYHAFGQNTEQVWQLSAAYYDPRLAVIVAYGDPFSPDTTPALQRRLVLSEFARALQHAYYQGREQRPSSLWLNLGFASWFGWREGVLAEAKDKTAIDTDALFDLLKFSQDPVDRGLVLHPLFDLLQVRTTADIVQLAKNRTEASSVKEPAVEIALRAFYEQAALWIHFLHDGQGGRYRERFLKLFQSSMAGLGGLDAYYLAFQQVDLGTLDKEFYAELRAEHEKAYPKVKLDRAWLDAPFADRPAARKPAPPESAAVPTPAGASSPSGFATSAVAVGGSDVDALHGLALLKAMHGDLDGALRDLEEVLPKATAPPESERIPREVERVKQFLLLRDGWFEHLVRTGDTLSGKYRGLEFAAKVVKVEDGSVILGENPLGLSKVPLAAFEPFEIARQAGRKEEQGRAEPWARFWPYILVGEKKWEQLLKDDSEGAKSLREDAGTWYPEVLNCAKAAVALNEIAATPEPQNAKDAEKFFGAVKSLVATYGTLPLVQRKMDPLRRAVSGVIMKAYAEQDPAKLCHGTWTTLGNGLANVVYDFAKPEEAQDFRRVSDYLHEYHQSLPATAKKEEDSIFAVTGGEFAGTGAACYRHFAEFATPLTLRFDVLFKNAPAKSGGQGAFTFMVGACDDGKESYVACLNFGGLLITDLASKTFKTFPYDEPTLSKKVFHLELRHDGSTVSTWMNGAKKFEAPCAGRTNGSVFLWFHSDNPISVQRLEIDGRVDPAWPEKAKAAFFHAKLEEMGFK